MNISYHNDMELSIVLSLPGWNKFCCKELGLCYIVCCSQAILGWKELLVDSSRTVIFVTESSLKWIAVLHMKLLLPSAAKWGLSMPSYMEAGVDWARVYHSRKHVRTRASVSREISQKPNVSRDKMTAEFCCSRWHWQKSLFRQDPAGHGSRDLLLCILHLVLSPVGVLIPKAGLEYKNNESVGEHREKMLSLGNWSSAVNKSTT